MSVKPEKRARINSTIRDLRDQFQNIQQNNHHYQPINCINNRLQIHRKLIEQFSIHILCICGKNNKRMSMSDSTPEKDENSQNIQKNKDNREYIFEIQANSLFITKLQVKHTFNLQNYLNQSMEYFRFQLPPEDLFVVQGYNFTNTKSTFRLTLISDDNLMNNNDSNCLIIKPIDLIQENARLRAQKLSKSTSKTINFSANVVKKLNLNWNTQQNKVNSNQNNGLTISCSNSRLKREARKSSNCNIIQQVQIKGVEYKKSLEKYQRNKSRSFSRSQKNLGFKNIGPIHLLQKSKLTNKNRLNTSQNSKFLNSSCFQRNQESLKNLHLRKSRFQGAQQQLSSSSYYTAKKNLEKDLQVPQKIEEKKPIMQKKSKQNIGNFFQFSTKTKNPKVTYSELRNNSKIQSNLKNLSSVVSQTANIESKKFNKNISQAKIAQVSKVLNNKNQK